MVLFDYDLEKMLYVIPPEQHDHESVSRILEAHPEVRFVSLVGIDIGGHDTDEKIPTAVFLEDFEKLMRDGVQTDGSSVVLPKIAGLSNAKVDIIPDAAVNWYVDHNYKNTDGETGLPVGTLRIPSFLRHNDIAQVGARVTLNKSIEAFSLELKSLLEEYPYVFDNLQIDSVDEIEEFVLTGATELEFWVKTPEDEADKVQLSTAQILKEQYWKRTIGAVRSSLERTLIVMDKYGFGVEMGHKEVGGVKAGMDATGHFNHVMEQLEVDWKYSNALQAADNENQVKYIVRDIFRMHGLEVTFNAKPIEGVAGNGEHTHIGLAAKLKDGRMVNLFAPKDLMEDYMSPIGYGALMGILKNYDIINPFVSWTNDAFNRLKPGYEAPVYLVCASAYMAMLDGIKAVLEAGKTSKELEASLSKDYGQEDFYLEKDRIYRSEKNLFEEYTQEERDRYFGHAPRNVWENIKAFDEQTERTKIFETDNVMPRLTIDSYQEAVVSQWKTELHDRIVPNVMNIIRGAVKLHDDESGNDYDEKLWEEIQALRCEMGKSSLSEKCLLTRIKEALDNNEYDKASDLQIEMQEKVDKLSDLYSQYKKNLF